MKYSLVIFDLDGTLLDTLPDLTSAANAALAEAGFPGRTSDEVRRFIGGGVAQLIRQAVPVGAPDEAGAAVLARFRAIYSENVDVDTRPFPGIRDLLVALRAAGVKTAVNSNKVDSASRRLCDAHFPGLIDCVLGETAGIPKKPSPEGARRIMEALGASPAQTLYVGDGDADLLTAGNAGIDCAWVSWGYRRRAELAGLTLPAAFDDADALSDYILRAE